MGQSINDIRHMLDLAEALRADAKMTKLPDYSEMLRKAADDLDKHAEAVSERNGVALV